MTSPEDQLLVLYVSDGRDWANFLSNRLAAPGYNIISKLRDLSEPIPPSPPPRRTTPSTSSLSTSERSSPNSSPSSSLVKHKKISNADDDDEDDNDSNYLNPPDLSDRNNNKGQPMTNRLSSKKSDRSNSDSSLTKNPEHSFSKYRATVLFLSPNIVEKNCAFPVNMTSFNPKTSVLLLLGVEIEEARTFFGENSDHVFQFRISVIDGTEKSISEAMVQIIEAYEETNLSDEDEEGSNPKEIYEYPPSPVQANKVEKVFPRKLIDDDREVYVLLIRATEEIATCVLDDVMPMDLPLTQVCDRLYSFTLPKNVKGVVSFRIERGSHIIGKDSVTVVTPLDQIKDILSKEVSPLTLLATALGLEHDDVGGVDTALAFKLQELGSAVTFAKMFPCEEGLEQTPDKRSNLLWPSLLHFAADLNLRTFCSELLCYPGMLAAALTENSKGLYPSEMAEKKGNTQIHQDLLKFVEKHKSECDDSDNSDYVYPTAAFVSPQLPPKTSPKPKVSPKPRQEESKANHSATSPSDEFPKYVEISGDMPSGRPLVFGHPHNSSIGGISPVGRDSVFGSVSSREDEDDEINVSEHTHRLHRESTLTRHDSDVSSKSHVASNPADSQTPIKALRTLGVTADAVNRSRASTVGPSDHHSTMLPYLAASPPGVHIPQIYDAGSRLSVSSNCDNPDVYLGREHKKSLMGDRLKSFWYKFKSPKRAGSEGDIMIPALKKNSSSRISVGSSKSEKFGKGKTTFSTSEIQERDSGSYSDEEKGKGSPNLKRNKQRVFKESDKPMQRRISRRALQAKKERIEGAPNLPKNRGAFRSFLGDKPDV